MEYDYLGPAATPPPESSNRAAREFTTKTLMCALSQSIGGLPSLNPEKALHIYRILDTPNGLYFALSPNNADKRLKLSVNSPECTPDRSLEHMWRDRPFIFSASLSVDLAETVCKTLLAKAKRNVLLKRKSSISSDDDPEQEVESNEVTLFDPCCGSGTTLYVAKR
jgi:hypothetical protein